MQLELSFTRECPKKKANNKNGRRQQNNYVSSSRQNEDQSEKLFVMQHMMNTLTADVPQSDDVWCVASDASNHIPSCGE